MKKIILFALLAIAFSACDNGFKHVEPKPEYSVDEDIAYIISVLNIKPSIRDNIAEITHLADGASCRLVGGMTKDDNAGWQSTIQTETNYFCVCLKRNTME